MKNLFLYIGLFWLFSLSVHGQNENANWFFGGYGGQSSSMNWVNFHPNPNNVTIPTLVGSPGLEYLEGCASVSDTNGNLLFVTDGKSVYQNMGTTLTRLSLPSLLRGGWSSTQNVIIVKKPNYPDNYYIFTIDGLTSMDTYNGIYSQGVHYTELSFSTGIGQVVGTNINVPLKDDLNVSIGINYKNLSEGITSVVDSDCGYWVIAHVGKLNNNGLGKIFCYHITGNGVSTSPSQTLSFNFPALDEDSNQANMFVYSIKISPDTQRVAIGSPNGVYVGSFNNNNGQITNLNRLASNVLPYAYSLDFSSNSTILYTSEMSALCRIDLANISNIQRIENNIDFGGVQLSDNDIYVSMPGLNSLLVIPNANNISTSINLNNTFSVTNMLGLGLPQKVWSQSCCQPNLTLSSPNGDNMTNNDLPSIKHRERQNWIKATNIIGVGNGNPGDAVVYHAGGYVELNPGFEAVYGSQFSAYIKDCDGIFTYKTGEDANDIKNPEALKQKEQLIVYPNPTNGVVTMSYRDKIIQKVTVNSIDGKSTFFMNNEKSSEYRFDMTNFSDGIYILSIETQDGQIINSKLVKN